MSYKQIKCNQRILNDIDNIQAAANASIRRVVEENDGLIILGCRDEQTATHIYNASETDMVGAVCAMCNAFTDTCCDDADPLEAHAKKLVLISTVACELFGEDAPEAIAECAAYTKLVDEAGTGLAAVLKKMIGTQH